MDRTDTALQRASIDEPAIGYQELRIKLGITGLLIPLLIEMSFSSIRKGFNYSDFQSHKPQFFCCVPRGARHTTKKLNTSNREAL